MRIIQIGSGRLSFKTKLLIGLILALSAALVTVLALALIGLMLFVVPVVAIAGLVYALLPGRRAAPTQRPDSNVVEGRYRVIDRSEGPE